MARGEVTIPSSGGDEAPTLPELPDRAGGIWTAGRPADVMRAGADALIEMAKVAWGTSQVEPGPGDHRFADRAWREDGRYRRLAQAYLVWSRALEDLVVASAPDWRSQILGRQAVNLFSAALAPTNFLAANPAAQHRAIETRGASLVQGFENLVRDCLSNAGMPAQIKPGAFVVGKHTAITPGAVVHRDDFFELIQYSPVTSTVAERPLLVVPPPINKYYILDLGPGRSLVEYAVSQGVSCFLIAWRNPGPEHGHWGRDDYVAAELRATDVVQEVSGSEDLNVVAACAGGVNAAMAAAVDAARGDDRVRSLSLVVTMIDTRYPSLLMAVCAPPVLAALERAAERKSVLDRHALARTFSWMRPEDLVFNYLVNNWLLGRDPPAFDILAWANDPTNVVARYNVESLGMVARNELARPGAVKVLGSPVDLGRITADAYLLIGLTDHLSPWRAAYMTSQLLGGRSEVVMTTTGHVQSVVHPPGKSRSGFLTGPAPGPDPEAWREAAQEQSGSWWPHWLAWLRARSGQQRAAPRRLGSSRYPPSDPAPGLYVYE